MSDILNIFEGFPIAKEREAKILDLTRSSDYRILLTNELLVCLNREPKTDFDCVIQLSEARSIAKLLIKTLKINKIEKE